MMPLIQIISAVWSADFKGFVFVCFIEEKKLKGVRHLDRQVFDIEEHSYYRR